ncbi:MAG: indole-3-glycerol phosphate synthase TrpC [Negativicutes bacterium]
MLNQIVETIRQQVAARKLSHPLDSLPIQPATFAFSQALTATDWALIAECKLASPSKGRLCQAHSVPELARIFTTGGATALSVHTSTPFLGKLEDIAAVRAISPLPILRKDFIIDEYQIYESRAAGADAILLIAAILNDADLNRYLATARSLGMDCLVEVHSLSELERVKPTAASLVGINNRDLATFTTDIANTFDLLPHCDPRWRIISESGIHDATDARRLQEAGVKGVLVGESLVRAPDIAALTRTLAQPEMMNGRNQHA